jgi:hypothetical protein
MTRFPEQVTTGRAVDQLMFIWNAMMIEPRQPCDEDRILPDIEAPDFCDWRGLGLLQGTSLQ